MVEIRLAADAEADYTAAFCWYAERSTRAAEGLELELAGALQAIAANPSRFPLCDERHRFLLLKRYPFQFIYRSIHATLVLVVAIAHTSRQPGY